jgi:hypothetical protein
MWTFLHGKTNSISVYRMDFNFLVRRYKQIAATRLAIAGLNVAYGIKVSISCQYTYLPVCLSVCPSVFVSVYTSVKLIKLLHVVFFLHTCIFVSLSVNLSVFVNFFISQSPFYISVCLSVCLLCLSYKIMM